MRLTKHRQEIIATLKKCHGTLSVGDIHKLLPSIDIVTIYRNLELFVNNGIIKKLHLDGSEAMFEFQSHPHHHAICSKCDRVIHFSITEEAVKNEFNIKDFKIDSMDIIVRGTCCAE